ncbi:MAG: phage holin family protein [Acidimicrobiales bacterium]|nr:phage holin family protein [Acidimicrobiales bacterium]
MLRLVASATVALLADALGLVVAALVVDGIHVAVLGFVVAVVVFAVVDLLVQPLLRQVAFKQAPALLGSSALVATVASFVVTAALTDSLTVSGATAWVLGPLVVWIVALVAQLLLPFVIFKRTLARARDERR